MIVTPAAWAFGPGDIREIYHVTSSADCGPGSLRETLLEVLSNDFTSIGEASIYFDVLGGTIKPKSSLPKIDNIKKAINFIGPVSLDMSEMQGQKVLLNIEKTNSVFINIYFHNALPDPTLRDYQSNDRSVVDTVIRYRGGCGTFVNCIFSNNATHLRGGAVWHTGEGRTTGGWGTLTFVHCLFMNNTAAQGGGAIYSEAKLTLVDCQFKANIAGIIPPPPPPPLPSPVFNKLAPQSNFPISWPQRVGGAVSGWYVDAINCTFENNRVIHRDDRHEAEASGESPLIYFGPWIRQDPPWAGGVVYGKYDAVRVFQRLNIKNCILIEKFDLSDK
jgi:predicted outer membrane repeat protein